MKSALHGLSRGIISMAQGGTFKAGFASGFSSSFFSPGTELGGDGPGGFTLRTTIAGVVGGTASKIGGGKFSNGAISGAFVHMFNAEAGNISRQKTYFATFGGNITVGLGGEVAIGQYWTEDGTDWGYIKTIGLSVGVDASVDISYGWIYGTPDDLSGIFLTTSGSAYIVGYGILQNNDGQFIGTVWSGSVGAPIAFKQTLSYTWVESYTLSRNRINTYPSYLP